MNKLFLLPLLMISLEVGAVVIKFGAPDEEYIFHSKQPQFETVGVIMFNGARAGCTGTLIDSRTVLTAAHCLKRFSAEQILGKMGSLGKFTLSSDSTNPDPSHDEYVVKSATVLPAYFTKKTDGSFAIISSKLIEDDIALLYLDAPILKFKKFLPISRRNPEELIKTVVEFAGYGNTGNGTSLFLTHDGKKRAARTRIDLINERNNKKITLLSRFRHKDIPLLGSTAPGDSGASIISFNDQNEPELVGIVHGKFGLLNCHACSLTTRKEFFKATRDRSYLMYGSKHQELELAVKGPNFCIYGTDREFFSLKQYTSFINANLATHIVESNYQATNNEPHLWSNTFLWHKTTERPLPHTAIANNFVDYGNRVEKNFYQVHIKTPVVSDVDTHVDSLSLDSRTASLRIPTGRTINSHAVQASAGEIVVNGRLISSRCELSNMLLRGTGTISVPRVEYSSYIAPESRESVVFDKSTLSQVYASGKLKITGYEQMSIIGSFIHKNTSTMLTGIGRKGKSSMLNVSETLSLEGGTLHVFVDASVERYLIKVLNQVRWTIIKAKHIKGRFDGVYISAPPHLNYGKIEYFDDHIDVVF